MGLGFVQLPDYYVQNEIATGRLVSVLDELQMPNEGIWAVLSSKPSFVRKSTASS